MPADLHLHTTFSDGTDTPEKVVEAAKAVGLTAIAITDHDTMAGIAAAEGRGLEIIPGIELTTETAETEIHILGYFLDRNDPDLIAAITRIQKGREERVCKICEKLKELAIDLPAEKVFSLAGHRDAGRPHIARALVEIGAVGDFKDAFNRYLGFKGPAYVAHYKLSAGEAIKLVLAAGGIPVFAHPGVSKCDAVIPELMNEGLLGLEVYYSGHNQGLTKHYLELARKFGLLVTGGSDYHGTSGGRESVLGMFTVPDQLVEKLKNEHIRRNKSSGHKI
jgi:hypothetical protein